jgi:hypothetical protein
MPFDEEDKVVPPFNPWPSVVGISEDNPNGVKVTNITQLEVPWDGRAPVKRWPDDAASAELSVSGPEGLAIAAAKARLEFLELCEQKAADPSVTFINPDVNSSWDQYV